MSIISPVSWIVMDVEGTTTAIDFVHRTLFPYAAARLLDFLLLHQSDAPVQEILPAVRVTLQQEQGLTDAASLTLEELAESLNSWIQEDRKHPALKALQGLIWQAGYESGDLKGHVYPEVAEAFAQWVRQGLQLGIYSSGSVLAQQLLFRYSSAGDLTPYLSAHFDTAVGPKRDAASYTQIVQTLGVSAGHVLFLSDTPEEIAAATAAGLKTCRIDRSQALDPGEPGCVVNNFTQISVA